MKTKHITLRLDLHTDMMLQKLIQEFDFNKSRAIRKSIRLLSQLEEVRRQRGELRMLTNTGESLLLLLS